MVVDGVGDKEDMFGERGLTFMVIFVDHGGEELFVYNVNVSFNFFDISCC